MDYNVIVEYDSIVMSIRGLFLYSNYDSIKDSGYNFLKDFINLKADFDKCIGSYIVCIEYPDSKKIYFSDNSGMMHFFINYKTLKIGPLIDDVSPDKSKREPNYKAIAWYLYYETSYTMETIIDGVYFSNPESYYIINSKEINEYKKNLKSLDCYNDIGMELKDVMRRIIKAIDNKDKIGCTITGGIDSRTVLAHLLYNNIKPQLSITGSDNHIDVIIAKKISRILNLHLEVLPDSPESDNWIEEAIEGSGSCCPVCSSYRLNKKAKSVSDRGILIEFGGLAGESYKNSFINQDYPIYFGKPNWKHFMKMKVAPYNFPTDICGTKISAEIKAIPKLTIKWLEKNTAKTKYIAYQKAGYPILQMRSAGRTTMNSQYYIPYNPLIERNVTASILKDNPYSLEMQSYQRKQVSKYAPELKNVETDRGLSCNDEKMVQEWFKSMTYLLKVAYRRIALRKNDPARVDACFEQGLSSQQFKIAFNRCIELGVISEKVNMNMVSKGISDKLFTIGTSL